MRILNGSLVTATMLTIGLPACKEDILPLGDLGNDASGAFGFDTPDGAMDHADTGKGGGPGNDGGETTVVEDATIHSADGADTGSSTGTGGTNLLGNDGGAGSTGLGGSNLAGSDGGAGSTGDGGMLAAPCGDWPSGSREQRIRFARAQSTPTVGCESETQTRTCSNGVFSDWSGTFAEQRCATLETCASDDVRVLAKKCGVNKRGRLTQRCVEGQWTNTDHCADSDVCVDDTTATETCGMDMAGTRPTTCIQGQWVAGACSAIAVQEISAGPNHTCGLLDTGVFKCWGRFASNRMPIDVEPFTQAFTADHWGCGLGKEGRLRCWGYLSTIVPPPTNIRFKKIGHMADCGHGLDVEGRIRIWNCAENILLKEGQYVDYTAGPGWFCGVRSDGSARCVREWNGSDVPTGEFPHYAEGYVEAAAGCALRRDGLIVCHDDNHLFPMNTYRHLIPIQGNMTSRLYLCAITMAGTLVCDANAPFSSALPKGNQVRGFAVGARHACTVRDTGHVDCSSWTPAFKAPLPTGGGYSSLVAGGGSVCWVGPDGLADCLGDVARPAEQRAAAQIAVGRAGICQRDTEGTLLCWGGLLAPTPYRNAHFSEIAVGNTYIAGILRDTEDAGKILMWLAADPDGTRQLVAEQGPYTQLAMGGDGYCAQGRDGLTRCYSEGYPLHEPLSETRRFTKASVASWDSQCAFFGEGTPYCYPYVSLPADTVLKQIAMSAGAPDHSDALTEVCALRSDGTIAFVGTSEYARDMLPANVKFDELAMGDGFLCGLTSAEKKIQCAGFYDWGQARPAF